MDLFEHRREALTDAEAPLAARMRPRTLDEFVGQGAIVGEGRLLRRAIQADQLSSLLFYGPPGTGKTTLARIIANTTEAHFIAINAVLSGVQAIRDAIQVAQDRRGLYQQRTILFVDEVHRFNKSQQDALLPWVENGTVILIGATTENPYFEVNKALVSRSRLFQLKPLEVEDLKHIARQALTDRDRGYGNRSVVIEDEALEHLANIANGDARTLLNALELAVLTTVRNDAGVIYITLTIAEESIQQRAVLYDKEGDAHFDTISAFIKSLRGSDPDAAMYWLARMVYAGEDPRFIFRRMLIFAGEDVGLAQPLAMGVVNSCALAFDRVGMPEGRYPLAQAALYLATCAKSNSVMGFFDALAMVEKDRSAEIPNALRDANRDQEGFGHGQGYLYPHAYRDHWVAQRYLPKGLEGQVFYQPSDQGYEQEIQLKVMQRREAQLAALMESEAFEGTSTDERLSNGPTDGQADRWLERTLGETGDSLAEIRSGVFARSGMQRHHVVLDLKGGSGLLTWEAVRQVPEGGVYVCVDDRDGTGGATLRSQAMDLPLLRRPMVLDCRIEQFDQDLCAQLPPGLVIDQVIGRNAVRDLGPQFAAVVQNLEPFLARSARWVLAESLPQEAQRLYALLGRSGFGADQDLYDRVVAAEEACFTPDSDQYLDVAAMVAMMEQAGMTVQVERVQTQTQLYVSERLCDRWFGVGSRYLQALGQQLNEAEVARVRQRFWTGLRLRTVLYEGWGVYVVGKRKEAI